MSDDENGWLADLATADQLDLQDAAGLVVENGITLTAEDWRSLGTAERAALTIARRADRCRQLADAGNDMAAAAAYASIDGGRQVARLMARCAGEAVAEARRQAKGRAS